MYQNKAQNPGFAFRDPYTFADPAHPGKTFMVFEGNTGGQRGDYKCKTEDLGYQPGDPNAEILEQVNTPPVPGSRPPTWAWPWRTTRT